MPGNMDERVVSMEFDNRKFEKNVKTSMKTLDDLKESLDFDKTGKSLDKFETKFKTFSKDNGFEKLNDSALNLRRSMSLLGNSAGSVFSQFAEITKITAMFHAAEAAVNKLERAIKGLSIDQVGAGFEKYTEKISSIKTISNATGLDAEQVNKQLDRLNWFTDETSAKFTDMVNNIGKFTSVGRQLDESITAMQGIATWGYHSGASVAEQSRAMYNLSQALGTGSVKLIDWKSIENAGMATKEFKEQAIKAAEAAGTLKRKGDKLFAGKEEVTSSNFNSTLAKGWFTSDVLMDVLEEYGGFATELRSFMEQNPEFETAKDAMDAMDEKRKDQHDSLMGGLKDLINADKKVEEDLNSVIVKTTENGKDEWLTIDFKKDSQKTIDAIAKKTNTDAKLIKQEIAEIAKLRHTDQEAFDERVKALYKQYGTDDAKKLLTTTELAGRSTTDPTKELANKTKMSEKKIAEYVEKINKIVDPKEREKQIKEFAKEAGIDVKAATKYLDDLAKTEETLGEKAFKSSQQSKSFRDSIDATKDAVSTGWMTTFQHLFGGLDKSIELWSDVTDILWDLFAAGASFRNNAFQHWAEEFNGWADLWNANEDNGPLGALRNIANTIIELKELLGSTFKNVFFPQLEKIIGQTVFGQDDAMEMTKNGLKTVGQLKEWRQGNFMGYQLKQVTKGIREFTEKIHAFFSRDDIVEKFTRIFTGAARAIQFFGDVIGSAFNAVMKFVSESGIVTDILEVFATIGDKISEFVEKIRQSEFIQKLFTKIANTFVWFYNTIKRFGKEIADFFEESGLGEAIRGFFARIGEFFTGGEGDVDENGKKTESGFFRAFSWVGKVKEWIDGINLKDILNKIKDFVTNFGELWSAFKVGLTGEKIDKKALKESGMSENIQNMVTSFWEFGNKLSGVFGFFKGIWEKFTGWLETSGILPTIRRWWDGIVTFFSNIGLVWEVLTTGKVADPKALDEKQIGLVNGVLNFLKKIKNAWEKVKGWFTKAWAWVTEKWNMFTEWLETSGILPKIREIWSKIKTFFGNIGTLWKALVSGINGEEMPVDTGMSQELLDMIVTFQNLGTKIRGVINWLKGVWDSFIGWLESSGILPKIREWWGKIKEWFEKTGKSIEENGFIGTLKQWWEDIKKWFEDVGKAISENGVFKTVSDFFTNLWSNIIGIFGGGEDDSTVTLPSATVEGGEVKGADGKGAEKKPGFLDSFLSKFKNADGKFDLIQGLSAGIAGVFELIGSIDWTSISTNVFGVLVDVINGLDAACGKLKLDNIIGVIQKIVGAFTGVMVVKAIGDITSTVKTIVKKGKDKSIFEQFTEILKALGSALLQIGISIALIAGSMWLISQIDPKRFDAAKGVMIGIGVFLVGFILVAYILTRTMGKDANKLAKTFAAIGSMFLQIAIAVAIMVAAIWVVSLLLGENGEISAKLRNAMIIVGGIMVVMALIVVIIGQLTKKVGTVNITIGIATFAGMAILLAVMVAAILLLQNVDPGKAFTVIGELAVMMGAIAALIWALSKIKKFNPKMLAGMVVMAVMLGLVVAAFFLLKDSDPLTIAAIAGGISALLWTMVGIMKVASNLKPGALKGVAVFAAGIVIVVAALVASAWIIAKVANTIMNDIVSFMSSLAAAGNSAKLVKSEDFKEALSVIPLVCVALMEAATVVVNIGPALAVAQAAWDLFGLLNLAGESAGSVNIEAIKDIVGEDGKGGILAAIQTALNSVTDTSAAENAKTIARSFNTLAINLQLAGRAGMSLGDGSEHTTGIQNIKSRLTDIQEIVGMANEIIPSAEGEADTDRLTKFAEGVANIGAALQLYNTALAKAETELAGQTDALNGGEALQPVSTQNIKEALQSIVDALPSAVPSPDSLSSIESWATMNTGEGGKTLFALGLVNIANAMDEFSKSAQTFASDNVSRAVESLKTLAAIQTEVPDPTKYNSTISGVSGWSSQGIGEKGTFAEAIVGMGNAMAEFGDKVKDIKVLHVMGAICALQMLKGIYTELNGNEEVITYFGIFGEKVQEVSKSTKSADTIFSEFGLGIEHIGGALKAFNDHVSTKDYDGTKVDAAVEVLKDIVAMQTQLKQLDITSDFWHDLVFGENGLKKLGEQMGGLGSRLTTFQQELSGFDLDINGTDWKNISGVLTFMKDTWKDLNGMIGDVYEETSDTSSTSSTYTSTAGKNLTDLSNGIQEIMKAMVSFNNDMTAIRAVAGSSDNETFQLGEWKSENWDAIKTLLNDIKQLAIDIKTNNLTDNDIKRISLFGDQIGDMFGRLNNQENLSGGIGSNNVSNMAEFMQKLSNTSLNVDAFTAFVTDLKTMAETARILQGETINWDNVESLASGFINRIAQTDVSDGGPTIGSAFESLIEMISSYANRFYNPGKSAGEQFALGFKDGIADIGSSLTPIQSIDAEGNTNGAAPTGIAAVLAEQHYVTTVEFNKSLTHLQNLNDKFNNPIVVNDGHGDIVTGIKTTNDNLKTLNTRVSDLQHQFTGLKVYIDSKILVGAIAPEMDKRLGWIANRHSISP